MKKSVLIAALLAIAAAGWILSGQLAPGDSPPEQPTQAAAPAAERKMSVRVRDLVARPLVHEVAVTGETQASRRVDVRAETEGQVAEVLATRGDTVEQGDIIARLRPEERHARLAEHKARLRQRQIEYDAAKELNDRGYRSKTNLAAAMAELDAAKAVVQQMEIDIARTNIRAPFDGIVDTGHVEVGAYVKVGDIAATIVDLDPLLVIGHITEREVGQLSVGAKGTVVLVTGQNAAGKVTFIAPVADPATRTYRFEITIDNHALEMRDGITARIAIPGREVMAHFVSPAILTLNDDGVVGIRSVDDDNIVRFLPVRILSDSPEGTWLGGLPETVRAIVVGQDFVVDGAEVVPVLADNVATANGSAKDPS
ncbi:MAG: efflux RND transporter periplasmic adaptor subunit [Alphaproteobacteria bacterium]|jgi:multidrug efflux system membrane fusion protein